MSGEVASGMLGADWTRGPWTAGLMVAHSRGEGEYRGADAGEVEATLTGLYPYGRHELNERVTVWGVAGYGTGELTLKPAGETAMEADMDLAMGAVGLRRGGGPGRSRRRTGACGKDRRADGAHELGGDRGDGGGGGGGDAAAARA